MWGFPWSSMFGHSTQAAAVPEPSDYVHETGLFAAMWEYQTHGETHRLSCAHIHQNRRDAEQCGARVNATVERMLREQKTIDPNYVATRLARNPGHQYLGVHKEKEIA
jgi:hypothetical protein